MLGGSKCILLFSVFMMIVFSPQAFELATGDYLFEPHSGEDYSRDEGIAGTSSSCLFSFIQLELHSINPKCYI